MRWDHFVAAAAAAAAAAGCVYLWLASAGCGYLWLAVAGLAACGWLRLLFVLQNCTTLARELDFPKKNEHHSRARAPGPAQIL